MFVFSREALKLATSRDVLARTADLDWLLNVCESVTVARVAPDLGICAGNQLA